MPLLLAILVITSSPTPSIASEPTDADRKRVRALVIAELKTHLHGQPAYRTNKVTQTTISFKPGLSGIRTRIAFDDGRGCRDRTLIATCLPQEKSIGCAFELTNCPPRAFEYWRPLFTRSGDPLRE